MIITRTPLRISLVGGGTDLPVVYEKIGEGQVLTMAIDKYIYLSIHKLVEEPGILLKYRENEYVENLSDLRHPTAREAIRLNNLTSIDLSVTSDIPSGSGLGSSSSFTVGILNLLKSFKGEHFTKNDLAEEACKIEIEILNEPIGKQDQYIAAYGGICNISFTKNSINLTSLSENKNPNHEINDMLYLVRVGGKRSASEILKNQARSLIEENKFDKYKELYHLTDLALEAFSKKDFRLLGEIIDKSWHVKKTLSSKISNAEIDLIHKIGMECGAFGGKLLGAGGSGYFFFLADQEAGRKLKAKFGTKVMQVGIDHDGSKVIYDNGERSWLSN